MPSIIYKAFFLLVLLTASDECFAQSTDSLTSTASDPIRINFPVKDSILQFIYVNRSDGDPSIDIYSISSKGRSLTANYIGNIGPEGGPPNVGSVFLEDADKDGVQDLIVLARWEINHSGLGTSGNYFRTFIYASRESSDKDNYEFVRLSSVEDQLGSGLDGFREGKRVRFRYKDAASVRAFIRRNQ